jgi:hypothetical protein
MTALEARVRRIERLFVAFCLLVIMLGTIAATSIPRMHQGALEVARRMLDQERDFEVAPKQAFGVVTATEVDIINSFGQVSAALGSDPATGHGALILNDSSGNPYAIVAKAPTGPAFVMFGANGQNLAGLGADPVGHGALNTWNDSGKKTAFVGADPSGRGALMVMEDEDIVAFIEDSPGGAQLGLSFENRPLAFIGAVDPGEAGNGGIINLFRANGNRAIFAGIDPSGNPAFQTSDDSGRLIWTSTGSTSGTSTTTSGLLGDLDNDGDVDFSDFLTFAANFGRKS